MVEKKWISKNWTRMTGRFARREVDGKKGTQESLGNEGQPAQKERVVGKGEKEGTHQ